MGCTSSAPNTSLSRRNSVKDTSMHEENLQENKGTENEMIQRHTELEMNGIKVLPTCDTLDEPSQLDSNNKTLVDISTLQTEKDINVAESQTDENDDKSNAETLKHSESGEKLSKLEEVVEKVVELYVENGLTLENPQKVAATVPIDATVTTEKEAKESEQLIFDEPTDNREEEMVSPTQSQSSRATRWEALADIAAELPPSLAVDPLTGQIYAVSK